VVNICTTCFSLLKPSGSYILSTPALTEVIAAFCQQCVVCYSGDSQHYNSTNRSVSVVGMHCVYWQVGTDFLYIFYLLFCTVTNKCTIISQIVTLLHVSTLLCHPQGACNQYLAKLHKYFKCSCW